MTGVWTPLDQHLEQFLRESKVINVTKKDRRSAVGKLMSWMRQPVLQKLTRRQAGAYITHLTDTGISSVTVNGIISNLASYQKYLVKRGLAKENVWSGQHLPTKGAKQERIPWETEEIMRMIQNAPTRLLLDLVLFGTLTASTCAMSTQRRQLASGMSPSILNSLMPSVSASGVRAVTTTSFMRLLRKKRTEARR